MSAKPAGRPVKVRVRPMKRRSDAKLYRLPVKDQETLAAYGNEHSLAETKAFAEARFGLKVSCGALSPWLAYMRGKASACKCSVLVLYQQSGRWEALKADRLGEAIGPEAARHLAAGLCAAGKERLLRRLARNRRKLQGN